MQMVSRILPGGLLFMARPRCSLLGKDSLGVVFCIVRLTEAVSRSDQHCWSEGGRCDSAGDAEWAVF